MSLSTNQSQACLLAAVMLVLSLGLQGCHNPDVPDCKTDSNCRSPDNLGSQYGFEEGNDCCACIEGGECPDCAPDYTFELGESYDARPDQVEDKCQGKQECSKFTLQYACQLGKLTKYTCKKIGEGDQSKCKSPAGMPGKGGTDCYVLPDEEMKCEEGYTPKEVAKDVCLRPGAGMMNTFTCVKN